MHMDSKQVKAEALGIFSTSMSTASRETSLMKGFSRKPETTSQ